MYAHIRILICTTDAEAQLSIQSYADNHPDVQGVRIVETWSEVLEAASQFELLLLDASTIPSPEALDQIPDPISVILLAADPNDCRRFRSSRVRACLILPVRLEAFQWTIRSMQPMYVSELA